MKNIVYNISKDLGHVKYSCTLSESFNKQTTIQNKKASLVIFVAAEIEKRKRNALWYVHSISRVVITIAGK